MRTTIIFLVTMVGLGTAMANQDLPPNDFAQTFAGLSAMLDQETLSPMDMAEGTYLAARYFSVGQPGLPYTQSRFKHAKTKGEASMAGLYMTIHGKTNEIAAMRRELETAPGKRAWLRELVGSEQNFNFAMEQGEQWAPLVRVLPSTVGAKAFSGTCMQSPDVLVRRAGLYWGYWIASPEYVKAARKCAASDPDPTTRKLAGLVLAKMKQNSEE